MFSASKTTFSPLQTALIASGPAQIRFTSGVPNEFRFGGTVNEAETADAGAGSLPIDLQDGDDLYAHNSSTNLTRPLSLVKLSLPAVPKPLSYEVVY